MGRGSLQIFLQKRYTDDQQVYKQVLNNTNHQVNANQNHNKIATHICYNGYYQNDKKYQVLARIWRKGNPCALLVRMQIGTITLENSMKIPQDIKNETII